MSFIGFIHIHKGLINNQYILRKFEVKKIISSISSIGGVPLVKGGIFFLLPQRRSNDRPDTFYSGNYIYINAH